MDSDDNSGAIRVVAIDDSALFLKSVRELLMEHKRVELVGCATGGLDGIELIKRVAPDLALIDLAMPGMNGLETTQQIQRKDGLPRVLMMSAHQGDELRRAALAAGADAFVDKRDLHDELNRLVVEWFGPPDTEQA